MGQSLLFFYGTNTLNKLTDACKTLYRITQQCFKNETEIYCKIPEYLGDKNTWLLFLILISYFSIFVY